MAPAIVEIPGHEPFTVNDEQKFHYILPDNQHAHIEGTKNGFLTVIEGENFSSKQILAPEKLVLPGNILVTAVSK